MHLISAWNHPAFADYARHCNDQWTDALYPLAQEAMRRGYYMPNRNSIHCSREVDDEMWDKQLLNEAPVFPGLEEAELAPSWAAAIAQDGKDSKKAPRKAAGCTIESGQEAKNGKSWYLLDASQPRSEGERL